MKNILLVHGFNGVPQIFNYFKEELERLGYRVFIPAFPVREEISVEKYFKVFDTYKNLFDENLIVVAHSIGNPMFIKYISKYKIKIDSYISLAGFDKKFYNEGKDILNEKVKLAVLDNKEIENAKNLIYRKYSIYSNSDHIVPIDILEDFCNDIKSVPMSMEGIGHMGKKSGLEKLPEVVNLILSLY